MLVQAAIQMLLHLRFFTYLLAGVDSLGLEIRCTCSCRGCSTSNQRGPWSGYFGAVARLRGCTATSLLAEFGGQISIYPAILHLTWVITQALTQASLAITRATCVEIVFRSIESDDMAFKRAYKQAVNDGLLPGYALVAGDKNGGKPV